MKSLLILILLAVSCSPKDKEDCHYKINFINNSDKTLYIFASLDSSLTQFGTPDPRLNIDTKVNPHESNDTSLRFGSGKPECVESQYNLSGEIFVFVFDSSIFDTHTWQEIKAQNLYDTRYNLTLAELQAMNYVIIYN